MAKSIRDIKLQQYNPDFKYNDFSEPQYDIYDEKIGLELLAEFKNAGKTNVNPIQEDADAKKK